MSFILDALRKSDAERQRAATPGLADVRYAVQRSRRNVWIPVLVLVLLANMLFMGLQWYRGAGTPAPAATPTPPPPPALPPPQAATDPSPLSPAAIRPLAREADANVPAAGRLAVTAPQPPPPLATPPLSTPVRPPPASGTADGGAEPVAAKPKPASRIVESERLPTAADLIAAGTLATPPLNLDLHVYSDTPTGRFVIINGRKYREGAQLTEGPSVETITAEGVILSSQGRHFMLSSQ